MGKRIVTIDGSIDRNGALGRARRNHPQAVLTSDVLTLVNGVLRAIQSEKISQLDIIGHGGSGFIAGGGGGAPGSTQVIGVTDDYRLRNINILRFLENCFEENAIVRLHGCSVAQGTRGNVLLWLLADLWKIRVQGAHVTQFPDNADRFEGRFYTEGTGRGTFGNTLQDRSL